MTEGEGRNQPQVGPVVKVDHHEDGRIWVITLNRPHRLNASGDGLDDALYDAWAAFRDDQTACVAILTGAGTRAFSAGADLIEGAERARAAARGETLSPSFRHLSVPL